MQSSLLKHMKQTVFVIAIFIITAITSAGVFGFMFSKISDHKSLTINNISGEATTEIDSVNLFFSMELQSEESQEDLKEKISTKNNEIFEKMEKIGFAKDDVSFWYSYENNYDGKFVSNREWKIQIGKEKLDHIITAIHTLDNIDGIHLQRLVKESFNTKNLLELSRKNAIETGKYQAKIMTDEAGLKLGELRYINTGSSQYGYGEDTIYGIGKHTTHSEIQNFTKEIHYYTDISLVFEIK